MILWKLLGIWLMLLLNEHLYNTKIEWSIWCCACLCRFQPKDSDDRELQHTCRIRCNEKPLVASIFCRYYNMKVGLALNWSDSQFDNSWTFYCYSISKLVLSFDQHLVILLLTYIQQRNGHLDPALIIQLSLPSVV